MARFFFSSLLKAFKCTVIHDLKDLVVRSMTGSDKLDLPLLELVKVEHSLAFLRAFKKISIKVNKLLFF